MFHKRLLNEFKENRRLAAGMVAVQWLMLWANIVLMFEIAGFVSALASKGDITGRSGRLFLVLAAVILIRAGLTYVNGALSLKASRQVKEALRRRIYEKLMRLGGRYREYIPTAEAVQISTEGVEQLEIYFGRYVPQFFYSLLAPVTLFFVTGKMSLKVAGILLLCVPLIPVSIVAVQKFAKKMLARYWGTYTELGDSFLECLHGLTTLKIYQADERYAKRMDEEAEKFRRITMRVLIMQLNSISIMDLAAYGGAAAGMIFSVLEYQKGGISLSQCFFLIMISAEFFLPLRLLGSFFHIAMNGNAAADKIFSLLDAEEEKEGQEVEILEDTIRFEQVSFAYEPGSPVLWEVSLCAGRGLTAFVGESGCGKTTLTSLMTGLLKPGDGEVYFGQIPISEIGKDALYRKVTRIRHDSYLFSGSVLDNLRMGKPDADEKEMKEALRRVELLSFVEENGGLLMELTERASNLSGGQKQRLALARALLHDSDIYIFDEATSNVDAESEEAVMKVVRELAKEKTVILISHRLLNVRDADRIFLLKDGSIMESGNHGELMEEKGYYYQLYEGQKSLEQYGREEAHEGA